MAEAKQDEKKVMNPKKGNRIAGCVVGCVVIFIVLGIIGVIGSSGDNQDKAATSSKTAEQNVAEPSKTEQTSTPEPTPEIPAEFISALNKAGSYAKTMNMSKRGVYDQLVSEYGEKFSADAAQYAIDNVQADWNANALAKAKSYQDTMSMSPAAIHDQLTSEHGEKFTQSEADYAIEHLND